MQTWTKRQTYIEWTYSMYSWSDSVRTYTLNEMCRSSAQSLLACVFELKLMDLSNGLPVSPMPTTTTLTHTDTHTHTNMDTLSHTDIHTHTNMDTLSHIDTHTHTH